jgi:1,4-alpha-glucan branching enzyme
VITRARTAHGVKLTFSLDLDRPVSVVGDFNGWDPDAHPLKPRTNGRRSAAVTLPPGSRHAFRYLADGGHFFDDPEADGFEDNGYGGTHGVLVLDAPAHPAANAAAAKSAKAAPAPARNGTKASRPAAAARPTASRTAKKPKT